MGFEAMSARGLADHRLITPAAPVRATSHRRRGTRIPLWFHGLLCRGVAEDLLTKSPTKPKEGLFLVRQSSNRGGCFVISVCTGYHVNHYLIETLESMFYVKRESGGERGRDIQACDLVNLVECYKRLPLDISGLTLHQPLLRTTPLACTTSLSPTPSSKDNHNYIPLYVDHRYYIGKENFADNDLETTSFDLGEPVTILLKETKKWWFGYNSKGDLGYVPSRLLSPSYDMELDENLSDGVQSEEEERVEISEFSKAEDEIDRGVQATCGREGQTVLDRNSNIVSRRVHIAQGTIEVQRTETKDGSHELQRVPGTEGPSTAKESKGINEIYVSSEYISACVQNHEQKLVKELMYAQRFLPSDSGDDREWVFREDMDVALLEEQIVPDVDMETDFRPVGHLSEVFQEDLWVEHNQSWNLPVASSVLNNESDNGDVSSRSSETVNSTRTESTITFSEAYDPVETYLRLCDCWSRPSTSSAD
ncbi:uncharacterized protein [Apostichopus japonicus]|uniref:uncharacterized protein isoform X3 n=1 Tax=Stichopus japonicus TaxID=307972 RepID=UPI003AB69740